MENCQRVSAALQQMGHLERESCLIVGLRKDCLPIIVCMSAHKARNQHVKYTYDCTLTAPSDDFKVNSEVWNSFPAPGKQMASENTMCTDRRLTVIADLIQIRSSDIQISTF